ncbi:MBL fold metallo-hydrolase [Sulfolobus acidocaldarius]|uniref:Conserved thermophile protein n=4 Tax=Sulfolobus acidocaldarius TaxID=2285 RepID=Q4JA77_SULAC|nr:MBL fold metallo-hydrolase [Sulfolobus acidocaldarius]AAY80303.1 conserved thermophile protein [Sulfolobus acidocaldarius DSM 639]AGE70884.1 hypothetical protein SacN8_04565 [Sulfolobus acidocaldarius N8]AGE73155.1 hypothetical protein SacRon12I_04555 [Sulfolobus acidocaldarius Ron12/I]ALU28808.1 hydrolase [Sulfolobus acidocaldarius]ALU31528.1 hydrolase [Sulfolobus acidocaldarius]
MIRFFLHSCFLIDKLILIDPHDGASIGLPKPETKAPLVLITHDHYDHNAYEIIPHETVKLKEYGEFTFRNYTIKGFRAYHDKEKGRRRGETAIYKIITPNGNSIVHLGDIGHVPENIEEIKNSDVLLLPVGGVITVNAKEATDIVNILRPRIVIPMHYWVKGHYMPLNPLEEFLGIIKDSRKIVELDEKEFDENTLQENTVIIFKV